MTPGVHHWLNRTSPIMRLDCAAARDNGRRLWVRLGYRAANEVTYAEMRRRARGVR